MATHKKSTVLRSVNVEFNSTRQWVECFAWCLFLQEGPVCISFSDDSISPGFPRFSLDLVVLDVQIQAVLVESRVVVGRHLALSRVEQELLEEAGDDQERPVLGQNLKVICKWKSRSINFRTNTRCKNRADKLIFLGPTKLFVAEQLLDGLSPLFVRLRDQRLSTHLANAGPPASPEGAQVDSAKRYIWCDVQGQFSPATPAYLGLERHEVH